MGAVNACTIRSVQHSPIPYHHVTHMNSDPEKETALGRSVLACLGEGILDLDGALDGINCAGELGQNTVASRIGNSSAVLSDQTIHDLPMGTQGPERSRFILLHETGIASHVSREDGCQPPLDPVLLRTHRIPRCNFR
jgi:hypothetical protein